MSIQFHVHEMHGEIHGQSNEIRVQRLSRAI